MCERFEFAGFSFPRKVPRISPMRGQARAKFPGKRFYLDTAYSTSPLPNVTRAGSFGFYLDSDFMPGLRWTWCDKVEGARIRHEGWFTDDFHSETIRGLVMRLPHGRGYLAGWSMGSGMCCTVERTIYPDELDAAHAADSMAERAAEAERDYQAEESARIDAEELEAEA